MGNRSDSNYNGTDPGWSGNHKAPPKQWANAKEPPVAPPAPAAISESSLQLLERTSTLNSILNTQLPLFKSDGSRYVRAYPERILYTIKHTPSGILDLFTHAGLALRDISCTARPLSQTGQQPSLNAVENLQTLVAELQVSQASVRSLDKYELSVALTSTQYEQMKRFYTEELAKLGAGESKSR